MKKGLSIILALMMALTAISIPVFAEEVFTLEDLADAFENAPDGEEVEITLGADIDLSAPVKVSTYEELLEALEKENANVILLNDITATAVQGSGYGAAGIVLEPGDVLDGGNYTLTINGANATWDCAIAMTGGTVKNLTIAGAMRGVFMPGASGDVVISDCVFKDVIYTFNSDGGSKDYKVTIIDSEMNGWTSFSNVHQSVTFNNCTFAEGSGYAYCRPYQDGTTFIDCDFADGYKLDASVEKNEPIAFYDCTLADEPLTAENIADMCGTGVTVVIDGEEVAVIEKVLPEAEVTALAPITLTKELDAYSIYNGSGLVEGTEDKPLEVVLNFAATQSAEEAIAGGYSDYITDFSVTISGLPEGETFSGKNSYLAGNYGDFGWIVIPLDKFELGNGTYPVLGSVGINFTYEAICSQVKNFISAIHLDDAVLEQYPNLNVGLTLEITNPENTDDKIQIGETYTYDAEELKTGKIPSAEVTVLDATTLTDYDVWDGKNLTAGTEELPLEIVMNFKANDTKEEAASGVYADWVTDFYVTFDGLENGSFVADDCYLAGNYGSYGWITIPMDGFTVENGKEYRIVEAYDDNLTYYDICDYVKDFTAAIHIDEAILEANPNLTVSLELKMFNPERPSQTVQVGETATYDVEDLMPVVYVAEVDGVAYETLAEAIAEAPANATVKVIDEITLDAALVIAADKAVTLDLNGYTVSYTSDILGEAMITNKGTLTIDDSSETKAGKIVYAYIGAPDTSYGKGNYTISNVGTLTLNNGTVKNETAKMSHACYAIDNNAINTTANLTINGGEVININNYAIRQFAGNKNTENNLTITDGKVSGTRAIWLQLAGSDASVAPKTNLTITGGEIIGTGESASYQLAIYTYGYGNSRENTNVTITGGTFTGDIALTGGKTKAPLETVSITGGTFNNDVYTYGSVEEGFITGGTFATDVTEYCATGFKAEENQDGSYGIVPTAAVVLNDDNTVTVMNVEGSCVLALAAYTDETATKLTAVEYVAVANGTYTFLEDTDAVTFAGGAYVKAMLLDAETLAPLCEADVQ